MNIRRETPDTHPVKVGVRLTMQHGERLLRMAEGEDRLPSTLARKLLQEAIDQRIKAQEARHKRS